MKRITCSLCWLKTKTQMWVSVCTATLSKTLLSSFRSRVHKSVKIVTFLECREIIEIRFPKSRFFFHFDDAGSHHTGNLVEIAIFLLGQSKEISKGRGNKASKTWIKEQAQVIHMKYISNISWILKQEFKTLLHQKYRNWPLDAHATRP